jgi:hypothetical protein
MTLRFPRDAFTTWVCSTNQTFWGQANCMQARAFSTAAVAEGLAECL